MTQITFFLILFSFYRFFSLYSSTKAALVEDGEPEVIVAGSKRPSDTVIENIRKKDREPSIIVLPCGHGFDPITVNHQFLSDPEMSSFTWTSCSEELSYESFIRNIIKMDQIPEEISYIESRLSQSEIRNLIILAIKEPSGKYLNNLIKLKVPIQNLPIKENINLVLFAGSVCSPAVHEILRNCGIEFEPKRAKELYLTFLISILKFNLPLAEYLWQHNKINFDLITNHSAIIGTIIEFKATMNVNSVFYPDRYIECMDWLIKKGVSIDATFKSIKSKILRPILHTAIFYNDTQAINFLVKKGVNLNGVDHQNMGPVYFASHHGKNEALKYLLEIPNINIGQYSSAGLTALHCAILNGHIATVKFLISKGFSFMTRNKSIYFLLHRVTLLKNAPLIEMLLENGANPYEVAETNTYDNFIANNSVYASRFSRNDPAIVLAIINDQFDIVEKFLDNGVSPNTRIAEGGSSLLHLACQLNHVETTKLLISRNADTLAVDNCGCVAFSYVSQDWLAQIPNYHRYNLEI